ncbi:MAG TPA: YjbQ family protein, partial [Actinomycetota bacterium]|nr:YjbQ family protein [Actinomycetota bacterium]
MKTQVHELDTSGSRFTDITYLLEAFVRTVDGDGLVHIYVPHATAGLALMETGSGSERDLDEVLTRLLPPDDRWVHSHGSPGHGRDHVLPAFIAPSLAVPVVEGRAALGTWQSLVLVDTNRDNPHRKV